ncbi:MAG: hypothetical protein QOE98_93 [Gaiellaceae bacterium]|jgi:hypothetical protein|nr:hypothetical protein [Gaiellaceae bacterium]
MATVALRPQASASRLGALTASGRSAVAASALSLLAAWIHFAYTASHWRNWWAYGLFFLATGIFQGAWVPAILRWPRSTWVALAGIAGNFAIVAMYVWSRTVGIPMGPHWGVVEKTSAIDLACTAAEIVIMGLVMTMVGTKTRRWIVNALLLLGVVLWLARLTDNLPHY